MRMHSFEEPKSLQQVLERIRSVGPDAPALWGVMNAHEMVCHLREAFLFGLGERAAADRSNFFTRSVVRWVALHTSLAWTRGIKTGPSMDQKITPTLSPDFERDRAELVVACTRFATAGHGLRPAHPIFGPLTEPEWLAWGWRHADHHLRQFGA
jgi:hypothetical protein